jgi:hypothetical protein
MLFNLSELVHPNPDTAFSKLEVPFSKEEIDDIL